METSAVIKYVVFLSFLLLVGMNAWGQTSVTVNGETLSKHGVNSAGVTTAQEATDSVTTGSTSRYYITPDLTANPAYSINTAGSLTSSFDWTFTDKLGGDVETISAVTGFETFSNYKEVKWKGTGTLKLNVKEVNTAGCESDPKIVPVNIISAPTAVYLTPDGLEDTCGTGTNSSLNITPSKKFWVTYSSAIKITTRDVRLKITINRNNGGTPQNIITNQEIILTLANETAGYFILPASIKFNHYDKYTITINSVSDRISRKNNFWVSVNSDFNYIVIPTPDTGEIQHITNM